MHSSSKIEFGVLRAPAERQHILTDFKDVWYFETDISFLVFIGFVGQLC
jgi:hypothetical protein